MADFEPPVFDSDPDLHEAIKIVLATAGFEVDDPRDIELIVSAIKKKLDLISANAKFHARYAASSLQQPDFNEKELCLSHLKKALNEEKIKIDRPEFFIQQPQTKNVPKRAKPK